MDLKSLLNAAKTSLSSKISGINAKKFSLMALQAVKSVQVNEKNRGKLQCQIKAINIIKIVGNSLNKSKLVDGYAINNSRVSLLMSKISPARIIFLNFDLKRTKMPLGIQIESSDSNQIEKIFKKEIELMKYQIKRIIESGVNVIITSRSLDEIFIKFLLKNGIFAVRRVNFEDLKRLAMITGGKIQNSFIQIDLKKKFDLIAIGEAEEIFGQEISNKEIIIIRGCRFCPGSSIFLRGATEYLLEEVSQSLLDAIFILKRAIEGNKLLAGGGAIETALYNSLEVFSKSIYGREQLPVIEFGEALMIIPKILIMNAGLDENDILNKLKILHSASDDNKYHDYKYFGLNLATQKIQNNFFQGIVEPVINKVKAIQIATEAAITILRIDDIINLKKNKK